MSAASNPFFDSSRRSKDRVPSSLGVWAGQLNIRPLLRNDWHHSIHSYYLTSPESPDGRYVLYFWSKDPSGHSGEIRMLERATGEVRILADNIQTEDAHRVACQQWISGGKRVAFHEVFGENRWRVVMVDIETGDKSIVAEDRQLGFGSPHTDLLPIYGRHWNPGPHRDLEIHDVHTGKTRVMVTAESAVAAQAEWFREHYGNASASIFFPVLSPDAKRVIFKLAVGSGGSDFRSKDASVRKGLFCADLAMGSIIGFFPQWRHPAWHPDSIRLLQVGFRLINTNLGDELPLEGLPSLRNPHPSFNPNDPRLMVADGCPPDLESGQDQIIIVGDWASGEWHVVTRFNNSKGARSWRPSHPHPVFSPSGKRIYFNRNYNSLTRLFVAEAN